MHFLQNMVNCKNSFTFHSSNDEGAKKKGQLSKQTQPQVICQSPQCVWKFQFCPTTKRSRFVKINFYVLLLSGFPAVVWLRGETEIFGAQICGANMWIRRQNFLFHFLRKKSFCSWHYKTSKYLGGVRRMGKGYGGFPSHRHFFIFIFTLTSIFVRWTWKILAYFFKLPFTEKKLYVTIILSINYHMN